MSANYSIYIEDYVLSYLKREADSLELSEIFFYGKRQNGGVKLLVYGAGREKEIPFFAKYELLNELVCRLTQAGPVFMVRQKNGEYKVTGFQTFYENNEAMQNYLIEWTSGGSGRRAERELNVKHTEPTAAHASAETERKKGTGSAMSAQLCLILVILMAIVISSANSYHKMERLNQSAREVFFAIENQEAGQESGQGDAKGTSFADERGKQEKQTQILVERDTAADDISVEDAVRAENARRAEDGERTKEAAENAADTPEQPEDNDQGSDGGASPQTEEAAGETVGKQQETFEENGAAKEDVSEEALSRNITRYYEIEQGDTLYTISQKIYGDASRVEKICELNEITDPDKIRSGQKIILP